jgi:DNA modification methylase
MKVRLINADVMLGLARLPDESVHMVCTSPPYWGLRDYGIEPQVWGGEAGCEHEWDEKSRYWDNRVGSLLRDEGTADFSGKKDTRGHIKESTCRLCGGWRGSYGLEPTLDCLGWATDAPCGQCYVCHTISIFREVKRVLRPDGTLWLNLGSSYYGGGGAHKEHHANPGISKSSERNGVPKSRGERGPGKALTTHNGPNRQYQEGLKPKDLCGVPWRVALALQADGWWLRSDIIWAKPNPMPESCTDRPTTAHEHIFLLTKAAHYHYDAEAVKQLAALSSEKRGPVDFGGAKGRAYEPEPGDPNFRNGSHQAGRTFVPGPTVNLRSVWTIATAPFPQAHFATFSPEIPRRCISAGSSEKGCCPKCGAAWKRMVEKVKTFESGSGRSGNPISGKNGPNLQGGGDTGDIRKGPCLSTTTTGWTPTCTCNAGDPQPCTVLDCFSGAGTTALVAAKLGRDAIGIELNPAYVEMSRKRIMGEMGMLCEVSIED